MLVEIVVGCGGGIDLEIFRDGKAE